MNRRTALSSLATIPLTAFAAPRGEVVTTSPVFKYVHRISFTRGDRTRKIMPVLGGYDQDADLALFVIAGVEACELAPVEDFTVCGSPEDEAIKTQRATLHYSGVLHVADMRHGMSGGGVFDKDHRLSGLVRAMKGIRKGSEVHAIPNMCEFIPVSAIREWLGKVAK